MEFTQLGRTGLKVSRLCLGTMNFGPARPAKQTATRSWTAALDLGINFFDTANVTDGRKGRRRHRADRRALVGAGRRSPREDRTGDQSLRQHGRLAQRIAACPLITSSAPAKTACAVCRPITSTCTRCTTSIAARPGKKSGRRWSSSCSEGKVIYVGSSNFAGWHIAQAQGEAPGAVISWGWSPSKACTTSPRARSSWKCCPRARAYGLGVIPWSPLAGGLLGGALQKITEGRRTR